MSLMLDHSVSKPNYTRPGLPAALAVGLALVVGSACDGDPPALAVEAAPEVSPRTALT